MAELVPLSGHEPPTDVEILDAIGRMGRAVQAQVAEVKEAFVTRNLELAHDLVLKDAEVDRLNREIFRRAVEAGGDVELREWATLMVLVARALERIGDNAVDIAEQTVFVVSGLFREIADGPEAGTAQR